MDIGQVLIIGFDGTEMLPGVASLLTTVQPAGVILFARNVTSAEQTHTLLRECQKCVSTPLFTCVDLLGLLNLLDEWHLSAAPFSPGIYTPLP